MALAGCSAGQGGGDRLAEEETCGYDQQTLLPAMEAALPADATVRVAMEMSGAGQEIVIDAVVAYTPTGAEMDMTMRSNGAEFALIVVDSRLFVSDSTSGGRYQELDSSDPAAAQLRSQAASMDIASSFTAWRAGLERVEQVGEDEIDGEPVCHYSLTVSTDAASEAQGDPVVPGMPETVTYELYLTLDDLMRRVEFELGGIEAEMNATHWNEAVDIEAPSGG
ncbi:LppX_LprAFG lipoprotein [Jiangella muralis]|uniref:LppX_LprAFG lipoprotein n=1 Tax=Jiangella muralis TaxID=702383 RepID=UPI0014700C59|nr:LppX_LprAFG lipoprotein [Jiangella muralis]